HGAGSFKLNRTISIARRKTPRIKRQSGHRRAIIARGWASGSCFLSRHAWRIVASRAGLFGFTRSAAAVARIAGDDCRIDVARRHDGRFGTGANRALNGERQCLARGENPMTRRHPSRRGYVLVVTLGLLVLAATVLIGVSRTALVKTQSVMEAQR